MRILFFTDNLNAGGKERRLTELMKVLISRNEVKYDLILMNRDIHYTEIFDLNLKVHYILRKTKKDPFVFYKLYRICKDYKPDIIHCWDSMTAVYSAPVCKILKITFVNGMVTNSPQKQNILNKYWLRSKLTFPFSDIIVGNSLAGLKAYKAPSKKSIVIHNGFNFGRIKGLVPQKQIVEQLNINTRFIIGMVATFSKTKDYGTYFKAARIILNKRKDVTFLAIGNGSESRECRELIDPVYGEYFRLLGRKSDVESLINAMDVCVLSTFAEGLSNAVMEYMALGKPVIATEGGGTPELVTEKTGFLIKQSDPDQLADKIELLLNDESLRKLMGSEGKQRILNEFSIDKMADNYIDLYKKLVV